MTALELISKANSDERNYQLVINEFVDAFRAAQDSERRQLIEDGPPQEGRFEGLVSAVVSALCRELEMAPPAWVAWIGSPEPFFVLSAESYALRVRLMLESPPPFRTRNVFVPENYLSRA